MSRTPAITAALALFDGAPRRDRLHVRGREKSCPVDAVLRVVPRAGRVLEVGCGHGLVAAALALDAPARHVTGVDIDARKIDVARTAAAALGHPDRLAFDVTDGALPPGPWDAIVVVDVLYLLDREPERALLAACVGALSPGGTLVLKETDTAPAWKHRVAAAQEVVATRVLRFTKGESLAFTPVAELAGDLRSLGCADVRVERVDRGYLHPHALVVARRPVTGG